jgi:hypothetical protein
MNSSSLNVNTSASSNNYQNNSRNLQQSSPYLGGHNFSTAPTATSNFLSQSQPLLDGNHLSLLQSAVEYLQSTSPDENNGQYGSRSNFISGISGSGMSLPSVYSQSYAAAPLSSSAAAASSSTSQAYTAPPPGFEYVNVQQRLDSRWHLCWFKSVDHYLNRRRYVAKCMFCGYELEGRPDRMSRHVLMTCIKVPKEIKDEYRRIIDQAGKLRAENDPLTLVRGKEKSENEGSVAGGGSRKQKGKKRKRSSSAAISSSFSKDEEEEHEASDSEAEDDDDDDNEKALGRSRSKESNNNDYMIGLDVSGDGNLNAAPNADVDGASAADVSSVLSAAGHIISLKNAAVAADDKSKVNANNSKNGIKKKKREKVHTIQRVNSGGALSRIGQSSMLTSFGSTDSLINSLLNDSSNNISGLSAPAPRNVHNNTIKEKEEEKVLLNKPFEELILNILLESFPFSASTSLISLLNPSSSSVTATTSSCSSCSILPVFPSFQELCSLLPSSITSSVSSGPFAILSMIKNLSIKYLPERKKKAIHYLVDLFNHHLQKWTLLISSQSLSNGMLQFFIIAKNNNLEILLGIFTFSLEQILTITINGNGNANPTGYLIEYIYREIWKKIDDLGIDRNSFSYTLPYDFVICYSTPMTITNSMSGSSNIQVSTPMQILAALTSSPTPSNLSGHHNSNNNLLMNNNNHMSGTGNYHQTSGVSSSQEQHHHQQQQHHSSSMGRSASPSFSLPQYHFIRLDLKDTENRLLTIPCLLSSLQSLLRYFAIILKPLTLISDLYRFSIHYPIWLSTIHSFLSSRNLPIPSLPTFTSKDYYTSLFYHYEIMYYYLLAIREIIIKESWSKALPILPPDILEIINNPNYLIILSSYCNVMKPIVKGIEELLEGSKSGYLTLAHCMKILLDIDTTLLSEHYPSLSPHHNHLRQYHHHSYYQQASNSSGSSSTGSSSATSYISPAESSYYSDLRVAVLNKFHEITVNYNLDLFMISLFLWPRYKNVVISKKYDFHSIRQGLLLVANILKCFAADQAYQLIIELENYHLGIFPYNFSEEQLDLEAKELWENQSFLTDGENLNPLCVIARKLFDIPAICAAGKDVIFQYNELINEYSVDQPRNSCFYSLSSSAAADNDAVGKNTPTQKADLGAFQPDKIAETMLFLSYYHQCQEKLERKEKEEAVRKTKRKQQLQQQQHQQLRASSSASLSSGSSEHHQQRQQAPEHAIMLGGTLINGAPSRTNNIIKPSPLLTRVLTSSSASNHNSPLPSPAVSVHHHQQQQHRQSPPSQHHNLHQSSSGSLISSSSSPHYPQQQHENSPYRQQQMQSQQQQYQHAQQFSTTNSQQHTYQQLPQQQQNRHPLHLINPTDSSLPPPAKVPTPTVYTHVNSPYSNTTNGSRVRTSSGNPVSSIEPTVRSLSYFSRNIEEVSLTWIEMEIKNIQLLQEKENNEMTSTNTMSNSPHPYQQSVKKRQLPLEDIFDLNVFLQIESVVQARLAKEKESRTSSLQTQVSYDWDPLSLLAEYDRSAALKG